MLSSDDGSHLPPEIITDILHRLPAKSLGRFRCVSKPWLSLISKPQFIKTHQNTHNRNHLIFISNNHSLYSLETQNPFHHSEQELAVRPMKLNFEPHIDFRAVYGSCNGLLLVLSQDLYACYTLLVLNPTTRESFELPGAPYEATINFLEMEIIFGFGCNLCSDDYKVVTISYYHYQYLIRPDCMFMHVYSLKTNTWRRVNDSPYDHSHGSLDTGVFVNGFLHWIAERACDNLPVVVAFSLADEKFTEVPLPDECDRVLSKKNCKLVVLGGKLAIFRSGIESDVWVMNEYGMGESWTQILIHGLDEVPKVVPMCLVENGAILMADDDMVCLYNVEERTFCRRVAISHDLEIVKAGGIYIESLVRPILRRSGDNVE